jgi:hypothetical protein
LQPPVAASVLLAITAARSEQPLPVASVSAVVVTLMVVASAAGAVSASPAMAATVIPARRPSMGANLS